MVQPPGFKDPNKPNHVRKLIRSIYGLKQAPRTWYNAIHEYILTVGFVITTADPSLFIRRDISSITYMLIYVDDILLTGSSSVVCQSVLKSLQTQFAVKNLGPIQYFLGIDVTKTTAGLFLHQSRYVKELLKNADMTNSNSCSTPCIAGQSLDALSGDPLTAEQASQYRSLVGSIKILRSDGGGEYSSGALQHLLSHHGVFNQFSCPHTPEQNGVAERKHQHILSLSRAPMHQSAVSPQFWPQIFQTAIFLINKLPSSSLSCKSPYEHFFIDQPIILF